MTSVELSAYLDELKPLPRVRELYLEHGTRLGWLAMLTITLANTSTLMASTVINVAIPDIMGAFGIGQDKAQWLATGFLAASTITMLMNAWLTQNIGIRNTVVGALLCFSIGTFAGGIATSVDLLILARILQGIGTGVITPISMSLVFMMFPAGRQGVVLGLTSIGVILAPALGPALGGALVDSFGWRYVFFLVLPFSLLGLPMAMIYLPRREDLDAPVKLDVLGLTFVSVAITCMLVALGNGIRLGWHSNTIVSCFVASVSALLLFIGWERRASAPLLDLRVFSYRKFSVLCVLGFMFGFGLFGSTYLIPLFLQLSQNMTAGDAGMMMLPAAIFMGLMFPLSGRLCDLIDQRILLGTGFLIFAFSCVLMARADMNTSWWTLAWWLIISRLGIGLMGPALNLAAIQGLPVQHLQQGSGALNFLRQLGSAFGVNLMSVTLDFRMSFHRDVMMSTQDWGHSDTLDMVGKLQLELSQAGLTFWEQQYLAYGAISQAVSQQAFVMGFRDSFLILAVILLATLFPMAMLRRRDMRPLP